MTLKKLTEFLDSRKVRYTVITHSQAFTAQEVASIARISGKELAKTVIVKLDGKKAMTVVPASEMVDFRMLKHAKMAGKAELADESEFKDLFPDCEVGAMPPFGNLYNIETIVADTLAEDAEIAFNAGTHRDLVRMAYKDFEQLVQPQVMKFTTRRKTADEERSVF